jgi:7,8-dihydropterin-6-yl-methyl-4-(beta-D-ribofuranosyl)aminobenzene 5'-phosphate synthase
MRISVLSENNAGSFTRAEHGLSYFVETDGKRILFDTGQSNLFLENARIMNIDILNIDAVVLSHGHFDHGNGLGCLPGGVLIAHPDCFIKRYRKSDHSYIGLKYTRKELAQKFNLILSTGPYKISERIYFLGGIPRFTDFESQSTKFVSEEGSPDYVIDDSALAIVLPHGLFIITGCGHAGIVNTLEYARKITGIDTLSGIMGGFHLKEAGIQLNETIGYLRKNDVKHILPSHCTDLPALSSFYVSFGIRQIRTGDLLNF